MHDIQLKYAEDAKKLADEFRGRITAAIKASARAVTDAMNEVEAAHGEFVSAATALGVAMEGEIAGRLAQTSEKQEALAGFFLGKTPAPDNGVNMVDRIKELPPFPSIPPKANEDIGEYADAAE